MTQIPPHFMGALVALERPAQTLPNGELPAEDAEFQAVASGVLIGFPTGTNNEEGAPLFRIALFTARHVLEDVDRLWAKFNRGNSAARFLLELKDGQGNLIWHTHEDFDVAAIPINHEVLQAADADYSFVPEYQLFSVATMAQKGVAAGDDIYVLGFPMGLAGVDRLYAIVRGGTLARVDDEIVRLQKSFFVDCLVFPGNSGGPVVNRGSLTSVEGTQPSTESGIIGIVSQYIPYRDVALSAQTGNVRVMFEENSGLVAVVPVDAMLAAAQALLPAPGVPVEASDTVTADEVDVEAPPPAG